MTKSITLFENSKSSPSYSSEPTLRIEHESKIITGWNSTEVKERTLWAIQHISHFMPIFGAAAPAGKPLFGAQQIPGTDSSLCVGGISFDTDRYAQVEIVKGSSAIEAAKSILNRLKSDALIDKDSCVDNTCLENSMPSLMGLILNKVVERAKDIAIQ